MASALCPDDLNRVDCLFSDLCLDLEVPRLKELPDPLEFYRDYVSASRPCILEGACSSWPALRRWTNDYLKSLDVQATVATTPDGWADAIVDGKFCLPYESPIPLADFIEAIEKPRPNEVLYIQKQNSNLDDEFCALWEDISPGLREWGTQVFGGRPDAANFWMGDHRAITSMHKDYYENLYAVVRGYKTFTLCPPHAVLRIPHRLCQNYKRIPRRKDNAFGVTPAQSAARDEGGLQASGDHSETQDTRNSTAQMRWILQKVEGETLWVDGRPGEWPGVKCIKVILKMGDVLYLPSMWFHQVEQSHQCVAVNFWYDMKYNQKYCYFKMAELLNPTVAEHARRGLLEV